MIEEKREDVTPEAVADESVTEETAPAEAAAPAEDTGRASKSKVRKLEGEVADLKARLDETTDALAAKSDQYLRLAAEYDNFRRRSQREREATYAEAYAEALASLFPVVDNLERAVMYADGENVAKGVELTLKSVQETLARLGVEVIDPVGAEFDPNLHNAVMHVEDETVGESIVVEVLQKGYRRGDHVLRFAMVKVAN
ncbi:MAG: nucleotide exchange factor GrpE [Clostridia bacterium]|nr:nucleotide exchange factor GrpE [Clostridia bacterium]